MSKQGLLRGAYFKLTTNIRRKALSVLGGATVGVRAIVARDDKVLLVKHTYRPGWFLPGGEVEKGETVREAIVRELHEEVGVVEVESLSFFSVYHNIYKGVNDYPFVFIAKNFKEIECHSPEIEEARWFSHADLPQDTSGGSRQRINEFFLGVGIRERWA